MDTVGLGPRLGHSGTGTWTRWDWDMDTVGLGHNEKVAWEGAGVPGMEFESAHIILFVLMPSFFFACVCLFFLTHCYVRCLANMSMTFVAG